VSATNPTGTGGGRLQRRISVGLAMTVRGKETDGVPFEDSVHSGNVSRTGASFATRRQLEVGAEVELTIPRRPGERGEDADFVSRARVVRVVAGSEEGERVVGVQFLDRRFHRVFVSESTS